MSKKNKTTIQLGFWSAVSTALLTLWFSISFGLYQPILHAPWHGIQNYTNTFKVEPFISWIIPCFLLTFCFLIMIICIHTLTSEDKKIWSLIALVFAVAYNTLLSACYYIQIVVVEYNIVHHSTEGLELWLFAPPYPHSIPGALEGIGYAFMSLSLIVASKLFTGNKLSEWIRGSFLISGLTGLIVFIDPIFPLPLTITLIIACVNAILLFIGFLLASIWFKQLQKASLQNLTLS